jgi:hypothetical protein
MDLVTTSNLSCDPVSLKSHTGIVGQQCSATRGGTLQ